MTANSVNYYVNNGRTSKVSDTHFVGETVVLTVKPTSGKQITGFKVNGVEMMAQLVKKADGSATYTFTVTTSGTVSFVMDAGGNLPTVTADKTGNLTVTLNPKSGYSFDKIATTAGAELASSVTVNGATRYNVVFKK